MTARKGGLSNTLVNQNWPLHADVLLLVRPPLKQSLFPVQGVAKIMATRATANFYLFFSITEFFSGKKSKIE